MSGSRDESAPTLWGREAEKQRIRRMVGPGVDADGLASVVLLGEPGIGKSSLWTSAVVELTPTVSRVVTTTCAQAESEMPYTGLEDLVGELFVEYGSLLPALQQEALRGAFRLTDPEPATDPRTVAAATMGLLRGALDDGPVLVAVDDLHWLDPETHACLSYAARRLATRRLILVTASREPSSFGAPAPAHRPATQHPADDPFGLAATDRTTVVRLDALSPASIRAILRERLGSEISTEQARRITSEAGGNPFWALEFGRREQPGGAEPTASRRLDTVLAERLAGIDQSVIEVACLIAALGRPRLDTMLRAVDGSTSGAAEELLDRAAEAGLVSVSEGRVAPSHPLIGAALMERLPPFHRRRLHRRAADLAETSEARALHLLQTEPAGPLSVVTGSTGLLDALDNASHEAHRRGAAGSAAWFATRALSLATEPQPGEPATASAQDRRSTDLHARVVTIAELHHEAGDLDESLAVLENLPLSVLDADLLERAAPLLAQTTNERRGGTAARAIVARIAALPEDGLTTAGVRRRHALVDTLRADAQCGADLDRHAAADRAVAVVGGSAGVPLQRRALTALASVLIESGSPADEAVERLRRLGTPETTTLSGGLDVDLIDGFHRTQVIDLEGAEAAYAAALERHLALGDEHAAGYSGDLLAHIELLAGDTARAAATLAGLEERLGRPLADLSPLVDTLGLLHLVRGEHEALDALVEHRASQDLTARRRGHAASLQGQLALQREHHDQAIVHLEHAVAIAAQHGVTSPHRLLDANVYLAQALIAVDEHRRAEQVIGWLHTGLLGARHMVVGGQERRLRALLIAQRDQDLDGAITLAREAVARHEACPLPSEHGRSLAVLAELHRRHGEPDAAATYRRRAHAVFAGIGYTWWAERLLAPAPRPADVLSPSELAVVDVVAGGATNRETAEALHLSVRTVENHLARIFRKLGIRSRAELTAPAGQGRPTEPDGDARVTTVSRADGRPEGGSGDASPGSQ